MLTKKQSNLLDRLGDPQKSRAPELSELAEAFSTAFGGPRALAQMLRGLVDDPETPDLLKTRAAGIVVNTISAASKMPDAKHGTDVELLSDDDLCSEAAEIVREALGISDAMDADLAAVVSAWPELSGVTKAGIVATIDDSMPVGHPH
jgi:hypothetical protein